MRLGRLAHFLNERAQNQNKVSKCGNRNWKISWKQHVSKTINLLYIKFQEQDVAEYADYEQDGDFSLEITNHLNYPDSLHQSDTGHSVI